MMLARSTSRAASKAPCAASPRSVVVRASADSKPAEPSVASVMAFSGSIPEIVNGRLAMAGFLGAAAAELVSGKGIVAQATESPAVVAGAVALLVAASFVPALSKEQDPAYTKSLLPTFWTKDAEVINGRIAMLAFAVILFNEVAKGQTLF